MAAPAPIPGAAAPTGRGAFPVVASSPGARIGHTGRSQDRKSIARILCLKLDHIGDMLIAAPALLMLRSCFPQAHITLICGPWNAGLSRRLKIADRVITADLYSDSSMLQVDHEAQARRVQDGIALLSSLDLGSFDLAVDMRRDPDNRKILKLFSAEVYAGIGDLGAFPFLDASIPLPRDARNTGPSGARLLPKDLSGGPGLRISSYGLHLESLARLDIAVRCDAVWSPAEVGIGDGRQLGVAVSAVEVRSGGSTDAQDIERAIEFPLKELHNRLIFGLGWEPFEAWGRWTNAELATLKLYLPSEFLDVMLTVRAHGHTSQVYPRSVVEVAAGGQSTSHEFQCGDEPIHMHLRCRAQVSPAVARSDRLTLRAGLIKGTLTLAVLEAAARAPMTLRILGTEPSHLVSSVPIAVATDFAGVTEISFTFEHVDCAEPIVVEIESFVSERAETLGILSVELACVRERPSMLPIAHVEEQLLDLAAMVALRFAGRLIYQPEDIGHFLSSRQPGSSAAVPAELLARRKAAGRRLIGIAIGANKLTKLWPVAYFYDLCHRFLEVPGVDLVFIGGPQEASEAVELIEKLGRDERLINLCASCLIEDLGEVLVELDGYVGLDTGTTHFAGRVGIKTVALFAYTHHPREWGPVGEHSSWILAEVPCAGCLLRDTADCSFGHRCMKDLTPAEVWPIIRQRLL